MNVKRVINKNGNMKNKKFLFNTIYGILTFIVLIHIIAIICSFKFDTIKSGLLCGLSCYLWAVISMAIYDTINKNGHEVDK